MSNKITNTPFIQTCYTNVQNKETILPIIQTVYDNRHDKETITPIVMLCFIDTDVDVNQQYVLFDKVKVNVYPKSS